MEGIRWGGGANVLAIDAGNTRVKWGVHNGERWLSQGNVAQADIPRLWEAWKPYAEPARIVISNVAGEKARSALNVLFNRWRIDPTWIVAKPQECGVRNGYQNPAQLGSDRWAALIGAWHQQHRAALVIGCGTAMTVDALSAEGAFLGGLIVPGQTLMHEALTSRAAGLSAVGGGKFTNFPTTTADAVYSGIMNALAGAAERVYGELSQAEGPGVNCFVTGGFALDLQPLLKIPATVVDNLVLEGLIRIARQ